MAECIEREAALRAVQGQRSPCRSPAQNRMLDCLKAAVIRIPAADVAPVVHGRWVTHYRSGTPVAEGYVSTCCDMWNNRKSNYCPHCGAKMDGGADHETD